MITFTHNDKEPESKKRVFIADDSNKLVFPERTYTITDRWGNVEKITTRQKTIYNEKGKPVIWTDADIEYYEKLQAKIKELKELDKMVLDQSIEELINEPETVMMEVKPGPYVKPSEDNFASWAPAEDEFGVVEFEKWMASAQIGSTHVI